MQEHPRKKLSGGMDWGKPGVCCTKHLPLNNSGQSREPQPYHYQNHLWCGAVVGGGRARTTSAPLQPSPPAPLITAPHLQGFFLCPRSILLQLARTVFETHRELKENFREKKNVNTGICSLGREVERDALTAAVSDSLRLFSSPALQKQTNSQLLETEAAHVRKKKNYTYQ